jgi:hypothetical protein
MKKTMLAAVLAAFIAFSCNNEKTSGESTKASTADTDTSGGTISSEKKAWVPVDSATAMKAYMETAIPGEQHKLLAASAGKWTGDATMWMEKGSAPTTSKISMDNRMIMDGRYQVSNSSGDMGGMPFLGSGTIGYDNYKKKFFSTWIDNMGTGIIMMEGTHDPATNAITYTGTYPNPANGSMCEIKQVYRVTDADHAVMEMWGPDMKTGEEYKTVEIKLTRNK